MKKLMTVAAVAMMSAVVNAASFSWGFASSDILDPEGSYIDGGTASLYINNVLVATASQSGDYNYGVFDNSASDTTGEVQALGTGNISSTFVGQAYKLVLSYTDGDGKDWEYVYNGTSSYDTVAGAPGDPVNNYETFVTDYVVQAGDWTAATPVPEPTSGMLMLLGIAGLALRRRRA